MKLSECRPEPHKGRKRLCAKSSAEMELKMSGIDEMIQRINELYHKSQAEGLTAEEKEEQARRNHHTSRRKTRKE